MWLLFFCFHTVIAIITDDYYSTLPIFADPDYNKQVRPNEGFSPDKINIGIFVNRLRSISEMDMTMVLDVFLQSQWNDHRLVKTWNSIYEAIYKFNKENCTEVFCNVTHFTLGEEFAAQIWKPDFYVSDAVSIEIADKVNDNTCVRFWRNGTIFYSNRVILKLSCIMNLLYFPFDTHTCRACTGSYKYHDGLLQLKWDKSLAGMYKGQVTANFEIMKKVVQYPITKPYMTDNFTEQCFNVFIERKSNIFIVTLYLPSVSLVILSWVNFWIDPKAIPARAGLSITAILAQITLIVGMASRFPSVSDLKVADLYVTVNFIYTFASLIEFAIVSYHPRAPPLISHNPSYTPVPNGKAVSKKPSVGEVKTVPSPLPADPRIWCHPENTPHKIRHYNGDDISRIIFPGTFLVWNVVFFTLNFYLARNEKLNLPPTAREDNFS